MKKTAKRFLVLALAILLCVNSFGAFIADSGDCYSVADMLQILKGIIDNNATDVMDINMDGKVTLIDGLKALKYAAGGSVEMTLEKKFDTTISQSGSDWWGRGVQYPRLVELSNGNLLATFEELNSGLVSGGPSYPVYRSTDKGTSWTKITNVRDNATDMQSEWNPMLLELSKPLGDYKAGTVLLAGCSIDAAHSKKSAIRLYASTDGGESFGTPITVAEAGGEGDGVWEPHLIQLDDGRLVCFYSDDSGSEQSQRIVYKVSSDGVNFSDAVEVVASKNNSERPGMPVVTRLGNGTYFMVYEVVDCDGISGNPVFCRTSPDGLDWGDKTSLGTAIESDGKALGSAPYCAWSQVGNKCGTVIVSGTFMRKGSSESGTCYFVSTDGAKTWKTFDHLIPYDATIDHAGYSNCIIVSSDRKTVYAINNPEDSSTERAKIVFAKAEWKE